MVEEQVLPSNEVLRRLQALSDAAMSARRTADALAAAGIGECDRALIEELSVAHSCAVDLARAIERLRLSR